MTTIRSRILTLAGTLAAAAAASAQPAPAPERPAGRFAPMTEADHRLAQILDEDLNMLKRADPISASKEGDRRFDDKLPDETAAFRFEQTAAWTNRLKQLAEEDWSGLSPEYRVNHALLVFELDMRLALEKFKPWQMPVSQVSGPQISLPQIPDQLSFTTREHLEDYAARLEAVPQYLDEIVFNLRHGLGDGRTPPRVVMAGAPEQALAQADPRYLEDPAAHAMYRPFAGADPDLAERGRKAIRESVVPAFREFGEYLRDTYVPACRDTIACRDLPRGMSFYEVLVQRHTTLATGAHDVHQTGLAEVARIRAEMMDVIARSDLPRKSELSGDDLFRAFVEYLRTDPRFYYTEPEALLAGYRDIAKQIDAELPALFGRLPRLTYGVREMPRFIAMSAPTAFYYAGSLENGVPGYFVANTWALDQRPKYEMIALTIHEAVPGHHFQVALAQELVADGQHPWRRHQWYTGFGEGWALYCERLGLEMAGGDGGKTHRGLYEDPYDDFGRLSYEMWRAMRLVVDTGMHAMGWTRDQAIRYMLDNSGLSKTNIEREVDRYIAWPGQALGYKMGEIHIRRLREHAESQLGDKFGIRGFHDAVLGNGHVTLDILTEQVSRWIESKKTR